MNQASKSTLPLPASPIIVTGATGYLGSALVSHLRNLGVNVLGFSRRGGKDNSTYDYIEEAMRDAAGIVHCAAITEWFGDDEEIKRVNGKWPVALYRQANECRVRKFVFISSIAVYGYWNRRPVTITENTPVCAKTSRMSDYGIAKDYAERSLMAARDHTQLFVLQIGIIYDQETLSCGHVANATTVYDIQQRLPYVHLRNVCRAVTLALSEDTPQGTYILVDHEQPNILQYNLLQGIASSPVQTWKRRLMPLARGALALLKGRHNTLRRLRHNEDCLRRRSVYSTYKITTHLGYSQEVRLADELPAEHTAQATPSPKLSPPRMRLAVIGYGGWGKHMAYMVSSSNKFELIAICDKVSKNLKIQKKHRNVPIFSDIHSMLKVTHCDGAIVCTPNYCHAENILELAPHVKQIYLEKPFANNRKEREIIKECIDDHEVALFVGHTLSQSKGIQFIQQKSKECGRLIKARFTRTLARDYPATDWRTKPRLCPGGVIAQLGVHLFDIALEVLGDFTIEELLLEKTLDNKQVWACSWKASARDTQITMRTAFAENNALDVFIKGESGFVELHDGQIKWCIENEKETISVDLDSGAHSVLDEFYQSWFMMKHGISERALAVAACYERSLELMHAQIPDAFYHN